MRKAVSFVLATVVLSAVPASAQPRVIDQSSPASPAPIPFTWAIGGGPTGQILYQTVTAEETGHLMEVRVPLACAGGDLRVQILDVDPATGQPGTTILRERVFSGARFPGPVTDEFQALPVRPPLPVAAGDRFTISLFNLSSTCGAWPGPVGDAYPGGSGWFFSLPNTQIAPLGLGSGREDLPFETIVQRTGRS
jgi:hypothetical protein